MSFTEHWNFELPARGAVEFDTALNTSFSDLDGLIGGGIIIAGENLSVRDVVGIKNDSLAYKVNGGGPIVALGFVRVAANTGLPCGFQVSGRIGGFVGLTPGTDVWSDGTGGYTQTEPAVNPQKIGTAESSTSIEIFIESPKDSSIVKATSNNKTMVYGTHAVTGQSLEIVSGVSTIDSIVASLSGGDPVFQPTLNEMAVRVQKSATPGKFHLYVSKLDGSSAGRWVQGTTSRNIYWMAIGDA